MLEASLRLIFVLWGVLQLEFSGRVSKQMFKPLKKFHSFLKSQAFEGLSFKIRDSNVDVTICVCAGV